MPHYPFIYVMVSSMVICCRFNIYLEQCYINFQYIMDRICVRGLVSSYLVRIICGRRHGVREMKAKGNGYLVEQQAFWWDDLTP